MQKIWSDASAKYVVDQASKIRESAAKWGQSATAILAAASLATAFKGRETLDAIDPANRGLVVIAVLAAVVLSGVSLFFAALAASGTTRWTWDDPESFRASQETAASGASKWLAASVWTLVVAFMASIVAVLIIWTSGKATTTEQTLVVGQSGVVGCGELTVEAGNLLIDGSPVPAPPVSFHTIAACPD